MNLAPTLLDCQLPENVRQYYLDAMGIDCWQSQDRLVEKASVESQGALKVPLTTAETALPQSMDKGGWDGMQLSVGSCQLCDALTTSRTQPILGVGNQSADILIVTEAPDEAEDNQGIPFVGKEGQLLTAMLKAIGLTREEVYISNIVKCRPEADRHPLPNEIKNCNHFLSQQITLIQPKVILAFGRIAAQSLLDSEITIGKLRLESHQYQGIPLFATYHPSYLLHKPGEKRKSWQDLQRLREVIRSWQ